MRGSFRVTSVRDSDFLRILEHNFPLISLISQHGPLFVKLQAECGNESLLIDKRSTASKYSGVIRKPL